MEYRTIGDTRTSLLGFGCMRFPTNAQGKINREEATEMLEMAYEAGVTYYDTAYMYHDGESERFVGEWLDTKPRDSYLLTTKLPVMMCKSLEDAKRICKDQFEKLNKDYFDFYLLHALNKESWKNALEWGIVDYCEELLKEGKIKHLGFSFHDGYDVFEEIMKYRKWDLCQIQYNYMDVDIQAGDKGYELAKELGVPMVIMEPVKGGALANLPEEVISPIRAIDKASSLAAIAYRWVGSHDNVKVVLSGMSTIGQAEDNLSTFTDFKPLSEEEVKVVKEVKANIEARVKNGCTGCRYCMPCPKGVDIPKNFAIWNHYSMYGDKGHLAREWKNMPAEKKADNCVKCGKCEAICPQKLSIREDLVRVTEEIEAALA